MHRLISIGKIKNIALSKEEISISIFVVKIIFFCLFLQSKIHGAPALYLRIIFITARKLLNNNTVTNVNSSEKCLFKVIDWIYSGLEYLQQIFSVLCTFAFFTAELQSYLKPHFLTLKLCSLVFAYFHTLSIHSGLIFTNVIGWSRVWLWLDHVIFFKFTNVFFYLIFLMYVL